MAIDGLPQVFRLPQAAVSAAELTSIFTEIFPEVGDIADPLEKILETGLAIPYQSLCQMQQVPLAQWLEDQKADDQTSHVMLMLASLTIASTPDFTRKNASVFGAIGGLRQGFCGEAVFGFPYPDIRFGLAVPVAKAIEGHGGAVWRGTRVAKVETHSGRVGNVVLEDGTEVRAPDIAIACGNSRIGSLFETVPPEAEGPLHYSEKFAHRDFQVVQVLDKPVLPADCNRWIGVLKMDATMTQWMGPLHALTPWAIESPKQLMLTGRTIPESEVEKEGGPEAILARFDDVNESLFPGYKDAVGAVGVTAHASSHLWFDHVLVGPKLPHRSHSVEGLWFVGEGSAPIAGMWMDSASSAGMLGARELAVVRNGSW
jgi:hypothetical protein